MRTPTVVLAAGEPWESAVLAAADQSGVLILKRCVDLTDLMASASRGQAQVAVISVDVPRLDAEAVQLLLSHDMTVIAVGAPENADRVARLGFDRLVAADPSAILAAIVATVGARADLTIPDLGPTLERSGARSGRTIAVWGPAGAPGRTTIAVGVAAELAAAGRRVVLVDADPYGGCVAARLGMLDEVSGLLAAARSRNAGTLDLAGFASACRRAAPDFDVLTGLPRAERRIEVRATVLAGLLSVAAELGDVVVDTGFSIEDGPRDQMTVEALTAADQIVVVGQGDPVSLARLARALSDLTELLAENPTPVRVVINRFRPGHGWTIAEVESFLSTYGDPEGIWLVPEDGAAMDSSARTGRTLVELGGSEIREAIARLAGGCVSEAPAPAMPKRRRAARARRR